jgi:hypothetical protein
MIRAGTVWCECSWEYDRDPATTVQAFRAMHPCALHPKRTGREGYALAVAETIAPGEAARQVADEAGIDPDAVRVEWTPERFDVYADVSEDVRAALIAKQDARDYRGWAWLHPDDRDAFDAAMKAVLDTAKLHTEAP